MGMRTFESLATNEVSRCLCATRRRDERELIFDRTAPARHRRMRIERRRELQFVARRDIDAHPMLILPDHDTSARIQRTLETIFANDAHRHVLKARPRGRIADRAAQLERRAAAAQSQIFDLYVLQRHSSDDGCGRRRLAALARSVTGPQTLREPDDQKRCEHDAADDAHDPAVRDGDRENQDQHGRCESPEHVSPLRSDVGVCKDATFPPTTVRPPAAALGLLSNAALGLLSNGTPPAVRRFLGDAPSRSRCGA